jgi:hypothetical protein
MNALMWLKSHAGYYDRIDMETFDYPVLIPALLEYSDYCGSHIEKSNHELFLAEFGNNNEWVGVIHGCYGYHAVVLHPNALKNTEIVETLAALTEYPLIDDQHYSNMTWNEYQEAFYEYGVTDLSRAIYRRLDSGNYSRCGEFLYDHDCEPAEIAIWQEWYESLIPSGEYFLDESGSLGCGLYLPVDDVAKKATDADIVNLIKKLRKLNAGY